MHYQENNPPTHCDRFIPQRKETDAHDFKIMKTLAQKAPKKERILRNLFPFINGNVLSFHRNDKSKENDALSGADVMPKGSFPTKLIKEGQRSMYDVPRFKNDYYLHLIDAVDEGLIGVVLEDVGFVFNKEIGSLSKLYQPFIDARHEPTSIAFSKANKSLVSLGTSRGTLQLWDWKEEKMVSSLSLHSERIGCVQWNPYKESVFATGSKDNKVIIGDFNDPSMRGVARNHFGEICGLSWNSNGWTLASGGNDNLVNIWDIRSLKDPLLSLQEHRAAVRALGWCPWKSSLLASGGGSGDMRLLVTNVDTGATNLEIHTSSQVCALVWDEEARSILTSHGFSKYQLSLWKYDTAELLYEFLGHRNRILSMIRIPSTGAVITASADETIRVWNMRQFVRPFLKESSMLSPVLLR